MVALAANICSGLAYASPLTVWLEDEVPDAAVRERADNKTGGTEHTGLRTLLFPAVQVRPHDGTAVQDLRDAVAAGLDQWDEFEIELVIAQDLQVAMDDVGLLRSREDAEVMLDALVFQGAAVARAFDPEDFAKSKKAEPFRTVVGGAAVPTAWINAHALVTALGRDALSRQDFVDNNGWQDFQRVSSAITSQPMSHLTWNPAAGELVLDGHPVTDTDGEVDVRPGVHHAYLVRDDAPCAAAVVSAPAGQTIPLPASATPDEVQRARQRVATGEATNLPESLASVISALEEVQGGPLYLGVVDDEGHMNLATFTADAVLRDKQLFSAVLFAEVGGGIQSTSLFNEVAEGKKPVAAAISGGAGVEFGISYFLIGLGVDGAITPARTISSANASSTENNASSVFVQPWGGIGAYILRPVSDTPTLSILGEVNWNSPAHLGYGGRLTLGVPLDSRRNWLRLSAGATYSPSTLWKLPDDPLSLLTGWFRIGMGARL